MNAHRVFLSVLAATICAGCSDPMGLPVSEDNDEIVEAGASWIGLYSVSEHELAAVRTAQRNLSAAWAYLEYVDSSYGFAKSLCAEFSYVDNESVREFYSDYKMAMQLPEIVSGIEPDPVPQNITYREMLSIHGRLIRTLESLESEHRAICEAYRAADPTYAFHVDMAVPELREEKITVAISHNTTIVNGAIKRTTVEGPRTVAIPFAVKITNNSGRPVAAGTIDWQIEVSGRTTRISNGTISTQFLGGLEPGESIRQEWRLANIFHMSSIDKARELFGPESLRIRRCFNPSGSSDCLVTREHYSSVLTQLVHTIDKLVIARDALFREASDPEEAPAAAQTST